MVPEKLSGAARRPANPTGNDRIAHRLAARLSSLRTWLSAVCVGSTVAALLAAATPALAYESFQNGRLRFGTGAEASVNVRGNLQQPFYYDSVLGGGGWYKLTYSSYPLNNAIGVGGDGSSNWNVNGQIAQDPVLSNQVIDVSGFVATSGSNGYGTIISTGDVTIGGQTFQVRNSYSLGQTDSFVRIVTRVTNTGATALSNLRVWVGTQDDWVGTTDSPLKRRGNLVAGVFTNIPTAATQSAALQISSGATGVLFFSTSPRAYTSINSCCSFSNSYLQNPATSQITLTNDGSYALFVRMNDLVAGASDEFTWYYAAGELANIGQIIAAVSAAASQSLTINEPVTPFIPVTSSGGTGTLTFSISPALPPGLTFNPTNGQISGTPTALSPSTVYTVTITDSVPTSTSATFALSVKYGQTINFAPLTPPVYTPSGTFVVSATASSSLPVSFSSLTPAVCTVSGATVTMVSAGACTLRASQPGDTQFNAAPNVDRSVAIQSIANTQLILGSSLNPVHYGAPITLQVRVNGINPTGKLDFGVYTSTGYVLICTEVPVVAGYATCNVPGGFHKSGTQVTYQVAYAGDANNFPAVTTFLQTVLVAHPTLTVTAWPPIPVAGRSLTLNAMVMHRGMDSVVIFNENGAALPTCGAVNVAGVGGLNDTGVASCNIPAVTAGSHTYVITYPTRNIATPMPGMPATDGFEQVYLTVNVATSGPQDYTDMWWGGAAENGWGVSVTQHGATQFIVLYVYDSAGKPVWYAMSGGSWNAGANVYSGALYQPTSAPFTAYDATKFRANTPVGTASITYTGNNTAILDYTIIGVSGTKALVRQPFSSADGQPGLLVNDLWWAGSQENGWGLNIAQQGRMLFPVWYTYDSNGQPTWFALPSGTWSGTTYKGDLYSATSSPWLGTAYDASRFTPVKAGSMSLTFIDQDTATMSTTIGGVTRTGTIVRQPY